MVGPHIMGWRVRRCRRLRGPKRKKKTERKSRTRRRAVGRKENEASCVQRKVIDRRRESLYQLNLRATQKTQQPLPKYIYNRQISISTHRIRTSKHSCFALKEPASKGFDAQRLVSGRRTYWNRFFLQES